VSITDSHLQGMTIDGIEVTDLIAAWKEREERRHENEATETQPG
jgi:hypothetical protein